MKVEIKEWVPIAVWKWPEMEHQDDVCGICRAPFEATCPGCTYPGSGCPPIVGQCSHAFHKHCIVKWLSMEKTQKTCPMCRQPFVSDKLSESELGLNHSTSVIENPMLDEDSLNASLN